MAVINMDSAIHLMYRYIYIYLINGFHMHRYLLILLDSALNTVGENVEYTKKKMWQQCKNESLYVLHCCTYQGFFKLGVQVLSLVCAKNKRYEEKKWSEPLDCLICCEGLSRSLSLTVFSLQWHSWSIFSNATV